MADKALYIWDPLVRCFHWSAVALLLLDYWLLEGGENPHQWAGYALGGLVVVRVIWGVVGAAHARFADFFPTVESVRRHLSERTLDPRLGHNPVGALMILVMLALMAVMVISGWLQTTDRFWGEPWVEKVHQYSADTLMGLAVVHVLAVLLVQRISGVSLVRPMLTGWRSMPDEKIGREEG